MSIIAGGSVISIAGCGEPTGREMSVKDLRPPVHQNESVLISMKVEASPVNIEPTSGTFENVTAVCYTTNQQIVGRYNVGTVKFDETYSITLNCSNKPDYFTFNFDQSGCEYQTLVPIFRVNEESDEYAYTFLEDKHCDSPELPMPDQ
jgi:hypothetical protein